MAITFDPHCLEKRLSAEYRKINLLPEPNKSLIMDFLTNYRYKKKLPGLSRKCRTANQLCFFSKLLNRPLQPFIESDVKELVKLIENYENHRKPYTLHTWKEIIKNVKCLVTSLMVPL